MRVLKETVPTLVKVLVKCSTSWTLDYIYLNLCVKNPVINLGELKGIYSCFWVSNSKAGIHSCPLLPSSLTCLQSFHLFFF